MRRRIIAICAAASLSLTLLSGCFWQQDYCDTIEENRDQIASLGRVKTDDAYERYVEVLREVAAAAPDDAYEDDADGNPASDWDHLADLTQAFLDAHRAVDFLLADRADPSKVAELDEEARAALNQAAGDYNASRAVRERLNQHVVDTCDISLQIQETPVEDGDD